MFSLAIYRYRELELGRILVEIPNELDRRFRHLILWKFGVRRGALRMAVEEAIRLWIEREARGLPSWKLIFPPTERERRRRGSRYF